MSGYYTIMFFFAIHLQVFLQKLCKVNFGYLGEIIEDCQPIFWAYTEAD